MSEVCTRKDLLRHEYMLTFGAAGAEQTPLPEQKIKKVQLTRNIR